MNKSVIDSLRKERKLLSDFAIEARKTANANDEKARAITALLRAYGVSLTG